MVNHHKRCHPGAAQPSALALIASYSACVIAPESRKALRPLDLAGRAAAPRRGADVLVHLCPLRAGALHAALGHAVVVDDQVDEHAEERHEDHEHDPEHLGEARRIAATEDVADDRDEEPDPDDPDEEDDHRPEDVEEWVVGGEHDEHSCLRVRPFSPTTQPGVDQCRGPPPREHTGARPAARGC